MKVLKKYKKVVYIDNNKELGNLYNSNLESKNLSEHFSVFDNFKRALNFMKITKKKELPDYLLIELDLPDMNGFEFLEQIGKINKIKDSVEIYVCSASKNEDERKRAMKFPFVSAFIQKPLAENYIEYLITEEQNQYMHSLFSLLTSLQKVLIYKFLRVLPLPLKG